MKFPKAEVTGHLERETLCSRKLMDQQHPIIHKNQPPKVSVADLEAVQKKSSELSKHGVDFLKNVQIIVQNRVKPLIWIPIIQKVQYPTRT